MNGSLLLAMCFVLAAIQLDNDTLAYIGLGFGFFCWFWLSLLTWAANRETQKNWWRYL